MLLVREGELCRILPLKGHTLTLKNASDPEQWQQPKRWDRGRYRQDKDPCSPSPVPQGDDPQVHKGARSGCSYTPQLRLLRSSEPVCRNPGIQESRFLRNTLAISSAFTFEICLRKSIEDWTPSHFNKSQVSPRGLHRKP